MSKRALERVATPVTTYAYAYMYPYFFIVFHHSSNGVCVKQVVSIAVPSVGAARILVLARAYLSSQVLGLARKNELVADDALARRRARLHGRPLARGVAVVEHLLHEHVVGADGVLHVEVGDLGGDVA